MKNLSIDFSKNTGKVKPMHAVNNGPVYKFASDQRVTNIDAYRDADIPYARNHNAAFNSPNGVIAEYYILDDNNDLELIREETFMGDSFAGILKLPLFTSYLIKLKKL